MQNYLDYAGILLNLFVFLKVGRLSNFVMEFIAYKLHIGTDGKSIIKIKILFLKISMNFLFYQSLPDQPSKTIFFSES